MRIICYCWTVDVIRPGLPYLMEPYAYRCAQRAQRITVAATRVQT